MVFVKKTPRLSKGVQKRFAFEKHAGSSQSMSIALMGFFFPQWGVETSVSEVNDGWFSSVFLLKKKMFSCE